MGKKANPSRIADNEAQAYLNNVRISPQKLNLVAGTIRGLHVSEALKQPAFSRKAVSREVRKLLESAISNAENNHNLDVDELVVAEAYVGKNLTMKRGRPRARGRYGKILKPFAELTIKVRQVEEQA